jgi:hypothetical protein
MVGTFSEVQVVFSDGSFISDRDLCIFVSYLLAVNTPGALRGKHFKDVQVEQLSLIVPVSRHDRSLEPCSHVFLSPAVDQLEQTDPFSSLGLSVELPPLEVRFQRQRAQ